MTSSDNSHTHTGSHRSAKADHPHHHAVHASRRRVLGWIRRGPGRIWRRRFIRRTIYSLGAIVGVFMIALLGLWWRLNSGPIEIDLATPWLTSAIEDNFGSHHSVALGGTQIERDENGRTSLRIRDIVVRDADGTVVASAPKAEVGISGSSLLSGHIRAESLNLVGAEMAVRIRPDGDVTVFAGGNKRPIATASVPAAASSGGVSTAQQVASSMAPPDLAAPATVPAPGVPVAKPRKPADAFAA